MRILNERDLTALHAAEQRAAIFGRDDLQAIAVIGKDRVKYLQAMLTQDITGLAENGVTTACLCDAQGKIIAVMTLLKEAEQIWLWCDFGHAEKLRDHLDRYVIMDDVELELQPQWAAVTLVGPQAAHIAAVLELPTPPSGERAEFTLAAIRGRTWLTTTGDHQPGGQTLPERWFMLPREEVAALVDALTHAGAAIGCHGAQDALRILAGLPLVGRDIEDGSLPLEVGLRDTVSYRKGCYVGQEAIAMMTYRGQLRRHMCWVAIEDGEPQPGWQLRTADGKRAGKMGTAVQIDAKRALGLATIARKVYVPGAVLLAQDEATGAQAHVRVLATTKPDVFPASKDEDLA